MTVVGSPFRCCVIESTKYFQVGSTAYIDLTSANNKIDIIDPMGNPVKYVFNNYKVEFNLIHTGTYKVEITQEPGMITTKTFHVFDTSKIDIINAPEAICDRPSVVGINMSKAGPGKLSATVKVRAKFTNLHHNGSSFS